LAVEISTDIDAIMAAPAEDRVFFAKCQLALFIYNSNRIEGTLGPHVAEGPTVKLLMDFVHKCAETPPESEWNSEGVTSGTVASARQLFQAVGAADFLLGENLDSPLTIDLICETHRRLMEGSYTLSRVGRKGPVPAGILRSHPRDTVAADDGIFAAPEHVHSALRRVVANFERQRADGKPPIALATSLFYEMLKVHPFHNGNGRVSRWFFAWSLMRDGFPFALALGACAGASDPQGACLAAIRYRDACPRGSASSDGFEELNVLAIASLRQVTQNFLHLQRRSA
jgi:fido (protein-threonine AMPylation protein)